VTKLRRGEPFLFTWREDNTGEGRTGVWLHPHSDMAFRFAGSRSPSLNRAWIAQLTNLANGGSGLVMTPEPTLSSAAAS